MMRHGVTALAIAALAAPAGAAGVPRPVSSISYETTACYGFCPVYKVTVNADGSGTFEGREHVAAQGQRRFRISRVQFAAFARHLEPVRPARGEARYDADNRCAGAGLPPTDGASTIVTWRGPPRAPQTVRFYSGCPQRDIQTRLRDAPRLLPIAAWIKPAPRPSR